MKKITKTLANCTPTEFFVQATKIRHSVEDWLNATELLSIRKQMPTLPPTATKEERDAANKAQVKKNLTAMLDAIMEQHPKETIELIGQLCFIESDKINDYPMGEYLGAIGNLISDENVLRFFSSLAQLAQTGILK